MMLCSGLVLAVEPPKLAEPIIPPLPRKIFQHEIYLSNVEGLVGFTSSGHTVAVGLGYDFGIMPGLQWGVSTNLSSTSNDADHETYLELLIGPTLSLPLSGDQRNTWFFRSGLG